MLPNLDLFLLAFLYGSFIACLVLAVSFAIMNGLLLAFSLALFSIVLFDVQDVLSFVSQYFLPLEENLKLGFILFLYTVMDYGLHATLASKPVVERLVFELKMKARHLMDHIEASASY
ncbi:hypothetical protein Tsubulata_043304 [Turnera subulata]|uniref:Uncharacterized protein n=1 Tax=Turnera subulata TaxID=218843 RepID=A0A9Q0JDI5_9ROSI|nr:hypothetical protein Tsubulata_043304 [Turnera subulata]